MKQINWNKVLDTVQAIMLWVVVGTWGLSTLALILFDQLVGTGAMYYATNGNLLVSAGTSLATSGLLIAGMFFSYRLMNEGNRKPMAYGLFAGSVVFIVIDVLVDGLTIDFLRYGAIQPHTDWFHWLLRLLFGGVSFFGEPLAIAILFGMPILKDVISDALPNGMKATVSVPPVHRATTPSQPSWQDRLTFAQRRK